MAEATTQGRYRALDAEKIGGTIGKLRLRISERFPNAGLAGVAEELEQIARESRQRIRSIERRNWGLRFVVGLVITGALVLLGVVLNQADFSKTNADSVYTFLQGVEASMNILVLIGGSLLFLVTVETRLKRRRALEALHELRSIVHVIDMHQLTKDPSTMLGTFKPTAHSPVRMLAAPDLERYLDYCSELLSLSAKVAALYAQSVTDATVIDAVADIERLTTNLSQKVWQKISLLEGEQKKLPVAAQAPEHVTVVTAAPPLSPVGTAISPSQS